MSVRPILRLALVNALIIALVGCARSAPAGTGTDDSHTIQVHGIARTYTLHVPSGQDRTVPAPLLIALHGRGDTGSGMARLTHLDELADTQHFLLAYPDGDQHSWADGMGTPADKAGVDDVAFISALIDAVSAGHAVDPARVYVTGFSNGGFMTSILACLLSDKVAAVAVVGATMPVALAQTCQPTHPMPFLLMHGQDDPIVPAGGGTVAVDGGDNGPILSDSDTVAFWAKQDGCAEPPTVTDLSPRTNDGTSVQQERYGRCQGGAEVTRYAIVGAGHIWPGGPQYLPARTIGKTTQNLDGSATLWDFFAAHPRQYVRGYEAVSTSSACRTCGGEG